MTTIYFLRHGETDYNRQGVVQGSGINSDLNDYGRKQAQSFFEAYSHIKFDAVYASQLKRTHQTLEPWTSLGYNPIIDEALNEFNWGVHEGLKPHAEHKEEFKYILNQWSNGNLLAKVEQGETPVEAWARAVEFFTLLPERHPQQKVLLCTHGRQLRVILSNLLDRNMCFMEKYSHSNTALTIVQWPRTGQALLLKLNDTSHLDSELLFDKHD